jgi:hypothetical protein
MDIATALIIKSDLEHKLQHDKLIKNLAVYKKDYTLLTKHYGKTVELLMSQDERIKLCEEKINMLLPIIMDLSEKIKCLAS